MTETQKFIPLREQGKYNNENNNIENKPETEQKLLKLQDKWLQTHDKKTWAEMQALIYSYTRSMVLKKLAGKKYLEPDEVDDATAGATFSFMSQYLRPNKDGTSFEVGASFAGLLNYKIMEALYKDSPEDNHISLNTLIGDDGKTELGDTLKVSDSEAFELYSKIDDPEEFLEKINIKDEITDILQEIDEEVDDAYIKTILRLYLVLCLRRPRSRHSKECFLKEWAEDTKCRQVIDLTMLELHKRMHIY